MGAGGTGNAALLPMRAAAGSHCVRLAPHTLCKQSGRTAQQAVRDGARHTARPRGRRRHENVLCRYMPTWQAGAGMYFSDAETNRAGPWIRALACAGAGCHHILHPVVVAAASYMNASRPVLATDWPVPCLLPVPSASASLLLSAPNSLDITLPIDLAVLILRLPVQ